MTTLATTQFDLLDHLHTHDADTHWIGRDDLATTLNASTEATHARMMRLADHNLIDIRRHPRTNTTATPPPDYRITGHGSSLYRAHLARMTGDMGPPQVTPDLQRAFEVTTLLHALGKDAA